MLKFYRANFKIPFLWLHRYHNSLIPKSPKIFVKWLVGYIGFYGASCQKGKLLKGTLWTRARSVLWNLNCMEICPNVPYGENIMFHSHKYMGFVKPVWYYVMLSSKYFLLLNITEEEHVLHYANKHNFSEWDN